MPLVKLQGREIEKIAGIMYNMATSFPTRRHGDRGVVAQLGERLNGIQEVRGSIPRGSTIMIFPPLQV